MLDLVDSELGPRVNGRTYAWTRLLRTEVFAGNAQSPAASDAVTGSREVYSQYSKPVRESRTGMAIKDAIASLVQNKPHS